MDIRFDGWSDKYKEVEEMLQNCKCIKWMGTNRLVIKRITNMLSYFLNVLLKVYSNYSLCRYILRTQER